MDHFLTGTINENVRRQIIDNLAVYKENAIDPITKIISDPTLQNEKLKIYGLEKIKKIRESLNSNT